MPVPRPVETNDINWILDLNRKHEVELSVLDLPGLERLLDAASYARAISERAGFLIAFSQNAIYGNPNFTWFKARYGRFIYVDRIAICASARGQGLARRLYEDLFAFARAGKFPRVVCEINADPPNPGSDAFHATLGFEVVGKARLENRGKSVRYLMRDME